MDKEIVHLIFEICSLGALFVGGGYKIISLITRKFGALEVKIEGVEERLNSRMDRLEISLDSRVDNLEASLNLRMDSLEDCLQGIQTVLINIEEKLEDSSRYLDLLDHDLSNTEQRVFLLEHKPPAQDKSQTTISIQPKATRHRARRRGSPKRASGVENR